MKADYDAMAERLGTPNEQETWPALKPLEDSTSEAQPFPFEALGSIMGEAARSISADVQAPDSLAGGSVLAAASLACAPLANVRMPHGQPLPLSLYVFTGAASGDRKSATDAVACHAIEEHRKKQARAHAKAMKEWEEENEGRKPSDRTRPPSPQVLTTSNATIEGIAKLLKSQSVLGIFSAEGGEMLGGHSLRDDKRAAGISFYLKAWGAEPMDSLRSGDGLSVLLGRRIAMHILVQPILLRQFLSDPLAEGQGLLARCLISMPKSLAGSRLYRPVDPLINPAIARFNGRVGELLNKGPRVVESGDGFELHPDELLLSPEAQAAWIAAYNQFETAQASGEDLAGVRPFASKTSEHAARIAGVVATMEGSSCVGYSHMLGGIKLADFYLQEHLRLTNAGKKEQHTKQLRTLFAWMRELGPMVMQTTVLQKSPRAVRNLKSDGVRKMLSELEERGYIRKKELGMWEVRDVPA